MTLTHIIIALFAIIFIWRFVASASREDKLISKYLLSDFEKPKIKATLTATPSDPITEKAWMDIYSSKNKKGLHPHFDTNKHLS